MATYHRGLSRSVGKILLPKVETTKKKSTKKTAASKKASAPRGTVTIDKVDGNWFIGTVTYNGKKYNYEVKAWPEGSQYGINNGGISKLWMKKYGSNAIGWEDTVVNYDRGWDIKPKGKDVIGAYNLLLRKFNNGFSAPVLARYNRGY